MKVGKKVVLCFVSAVISIAVCFAMSGCRTDKAETDVPTETAKVIVTFIGDGGTETSSQEIRQGEKITKPPDPEKMNYYFIGWFNGDNEWDFETMKVEKDVTLTAKWEAEFTSSYLPRGK